MAASLSAEAAALAGADRRLLTDSVARAATLCAARDSAPARSPSACAVDRKPRWTTALRLPGLSYSFATSSAEVLRTALRADIAGFLGLPVASIAVSGVAAGSVVASLEIQAASAPDAAALGAILDPAIASGDLAADLPALSGEALSAERAAACLPVASVACRAPRGRSPARPGSRSPHRRSLPRSHGRRGRPRCLGL